MFRQFASREIVNVAMVVTGFTVVCSILLYIFIKADMMQGAKSYESTLADTIYRSTKYAMLKSDFSSLEQILKNIGEQEQVEYARIFKSLGEVRFSSDSREIGTMVAGDSPGCAGCHQGSEPSSSSASMVHSSLYVNEREGDVLSMVVPIPNGPDCSTGECHQYHPPEDELLGVLEIGVSQKQVNHCLMVLKWRMVAFCVMILILTLGGVTALLWRNVMLPLNQVMDFAERRASGDFEVKPPRGIGDLKRLTDAIEKMNPPGAGTGRGDRDSGGRPKDS